MSLFEKNKNRSKVENQYCSMGLLRQQTMMISSADHHDLSIVCQAQAYRIVAQQKSVPLQPVEDGWMRAHPSHPPSLRASTNDSSCKVCE